MQKKQVSRGIAPQKLFTSMALTLLTGALTACATTSNELRIGKLSDRDRIYVGRLLVDFGGVPAKDLKCEVYINRDIVPVFHLAPDGYFFYKTDRSEARLSRISCYHQPTFYVAAWHHKALPFKPFPRPEDPKQAIYFGDIHITWKFDQDATAAAAEKEPMSSTPPRVGHVHDSGSLKVEIKSDFELMNRLFYEKVENAREHEFVLKEQLLEKSN